MPRRRARPTSPVAAYEPDVARVHAATQAGRSRNLPAIALRTFHPRIRAEAAARVAAYLPQWAPEGPTRDGLRVPRRFFRRSRRRGLDGLGSCVQFGSAGGSSVGTRVRRGRAGTGVHHRRPAGGACLRRGYERSRYFRWLRRRRAYWSRRARPLARRRCAPSGTAFAKRRPSSHHERGSRDEEQQQYTGHDPTEVVARARPYRRRPSRHEIQPMQGAVLQRCTNIGGSRHATCIDPLPWIRYVDFRPNRTAPRAADIQRRMRRIFRRARIPRSPIPYRTFGRGSGVHHTRHLRRLSGLVLPLMTRVRCRLTESRGSREI